MKLFDKFRKNAQSKMTWDESKEYLKEKVFLIGLSFVDKNGDLIEQYQTHGTIVELTDNGLFKIKREDNSIFQMPYDSETIKKADKGEYRERSTGQIVKDPDYIMTWEITINENGDTNEIKKVGFVSAE